MSTALRSKRGENQKSEIGDKTKKSNQMDSGMVPIASGKNKHGSRRGLLCFKPYKHFWSKYEPKAKDQSSGSGIKSAPLSIDSRKQTKVKKCFYMSFLRGSDSK